MSNKIVKISALTMAGMFCISATLQAQAIPPFVRDANFCYNDDKGSSHTVYLNSCKVMDQFNAVLACQRDAGLRNQDGGAAVKRITDAGPVAVNAYMDSRKPPQCTYKGPNPLAWQEHALWCADGRNGSSHQEYVRNCSQMDQFNSILACQRDAAKGNNDGGAAVNAVMATGPAKVNAFMADKIKVPCLSGTAPASKPTAQTRSNITCAKGAGTECISWSNGITCTQGAGRACVAWSNGLKCVEGAGAACRKWSNGVSCTQGAGMSCQQWSNGATCVKAGGIGCIEYTQGGPF